MWERLGVLASSRKSFAFETTLASRTYASWIQKRQAEGYRTRLVFLWLPSPEEAIDRVADRVRLGGHHIPEEVIRRRYKSGLRNLFELYLPLIDRWSVLDGTKGVNWRVIARGKTTQLTQILDPATWSLINVHH